MYTHNYVYILTFLHMYMTQAVWTVVALADGRIASGSWDKTIHIWDATTGECVIVCEKSGSAKSVMGAGAGAEAGAVKSEGCGCILS